MTGTQTTALSERLAALREEDRPALVGYLPAGFPSLEGSQRAIRTMVENGVDIVEVGVPYSDPVMDGPVIQVAAEAALRGGMRVADTFEVVRASVEAGAPTVVMTYWNPVERYGVGAFAAALRDAGGSGLITPDLIPDEAAAWTEAAATQGLDQIFLVAPSSTDARLAITTEAASGFVYATAVMGVTGQREQTSDLAPALVARVRRFTDKPIGVGLGVGNGDQAADIGRFADAVIVGSALVRCLVDASSEDEGLQALATLARDLRSGVERARNP